MKIRVLYFRKCTVPVEPARFSPVVRSPSSNKPLLFDPTVTSSILFKIAQHQQEAIFHHFQTSIPQFFGHKKKIFCIMPSEEQLSPTEVFDLLCHKNNTNQNERPPLC